MFQNDAKGLTFPRPIRFGRAPASRPEKEPSGFKAHHHVWFSLVLIGVYLLACLLHDDTSEIPSHGRHSSCSIFHIILRGLML